MGWASKAQDPDSITSDQPGLGRVVEERHKSFALFFFSFFFLRGEIHNPQGSPTAITVFFSLETLSAPVQKGMTLFPLEGKAAIVFSQICSQLGLLSQPSEHMCWREGEGGISPTWEGGRHPSFSRRMWLQQLKVQVDPDPGSTDCPS